MSISFLLLLFEFHVHGPWASLSRLLELDTFEEVQAVLLTRQVDALPNIVDFTAYDRLFLLGGPDWFWIVDCPRKVSFSTPPPVLDIVRFRR